MLKGWSLIGDALSHAIVPGVALTYIFGLPLFIGALFSGGLAAGNAISQTKNKLERRRCYWANFQFIFWADLYSINVAGVC